MMRHSGCRALVVSFCIAGCSFDFTDIPSDTPARVSVDVGSSTQTDSLIVRAALHPGRDSDTHIRAVLSDLLVSGRVLPSIPGFNGVQAYQANWSLSADLPADAALVVRAPDIAGLQSTAQTIAVSIPVRIGADTLLVNDDESVVLRLALDRAPAAQASWFVEVTDSTGARGLNVLPPSQLPEQIIIPRSWLSASRVQNVRLRVTQRLSGELIPGEYDWAIQADSYIYWTVIFSVNE